LSEVGADTFQVFLVDNGSTMWAHWKQIQHWIHVLVWRSLGYDDNGMELYFSDPDRDQIRVMENPRQEIKLFDEATKLATPQKPVDGGELVATDLAPKLKEIAVAWSKANLKKSKSPTKGKTVLILTDGVWDGMQDEYGMDTTVLHILDDLITNHQHVTIEEYRAAHDGRDLPTSEVRAEVIRYLEKHRPITLQFIQFGRDEKGATRLRRLDDGLKGNPEEPRYP
jgi:hypothetical protein